MTTRRQLRNMNLGIKHGGRFAAATKTPDTVTLAPGGWGYISGASDEAINTRLASREVYDELIDRENSREIRDVTAINVARDLGNWDRMNLTLLGRTGTGDKGALLAELKPMSMTSWTGPEIERLQIKALMSWVKNGGDND